MNTQRGYSMVELMVVVGILAIIAVAASNLFLVSLSGGGKSGGTNELRANGDYAITTMERMIRNALRIEGNCVADMGQLTIVNPDGGTSVFSTSPDGRVASNSGFLTSEAVSVVGIVDFDCLQAGDSGVPNKVNISFRLQKANQLTNRFEEVSADFATSVVVRSY